MKPTDKLVTTFTLLGVLITGVLALLLALGAILREDLNAAALPLVAAALAFGLLANGIFRS